MNTDDLEPRLRRLPLRQVPHAWRAEILQAARPAQANVCSPGDLRVGWRLLFSRISAAGWAFAGLWMALIAIHVLLIGTDPPASVSQAAGAAPESFSVWRLKCARIEQLINEDPLISAEPPADSPTRDFESPRSGRRHDPPHDSHNLLTCV